MIVGDPLVTEINTSHPVIIVINYGWYADSRFAVCFVLFFFSRGFYFFNVTLGCHLSLSTDFLILWTVDTIVTTSLSIHFDIREP